MRYPTGLPGNAPFRAVVIESVEDNQILARDQHGASMALPRIIRVREPIVGESWLVDRTFGSWTLAAVVDSFAPYSHVPTGTMLDFAGAEAPDGWLLTDGSEVLIEDYPILYEVIGTTFGGDGETTFRLPDRRGRVSVGEGTLGSDTYTRGETGGEARHVLSSAEMPSHSHDQTAHNHSMSHTHSNPNVNSNGAHEHSGRFRNFDQGTGSVAFWTAVRPGDTAGTDAVSTITLGSDGGHVHSQGDTGGSSSSSTGDGSAQGSTGPTGSTGGGNAHENRQPYLVVTHIIKT